MPSVYRVIVIFDKSLDAYGGNLSKYSLLQKYIRLWQKMNSATFCDLGIMESQDLYGGGKTLSSNEDSIIFLISYSLQDSVSSISISPSVQSDQSTIVFKILPVKEHIKGASYWKFNNSVLNDKDFVSQMKIKIPVFYEEATELSNPNDRWGYVKYHTRQFSLKISKEKAKQRNTKRIGLESRIKELESSISTKSDSALINEYNECKQELEILYDYITQGIILRSRTTWYEHGEKSTKYFLNLEKRNKAKTHVRKILLQNNLETTEPKAIT